MIHAVLVACPLTLHGIKGHAGFSTAEGQLARSTFLRRRSFPQRPVRGNFLLRVLPASLATNLKLVQERRCESGTI